MIKFYNIIPNIRSIILLHLYSIQTKYIKRKNNIYKTIIFDYSRRVKIVTSITKLHVPLEKYGSILYYNIIVLYSHYAIYI